MKRIIASKALSGCVLLMSTLFLSSCSSLWLIGEGEEDSYLSSKESQKPVTVPKEQYDELAKKYQTLLDESKNTNLPTLGNTVTVLDPSDLLNQIDVNIPDQSKTRVDPMLKPQQRPEVVIGSYNVKKLNQSDSIDDQITKLRQVQTLAKANKYDQALVLLRELEDSSERQIAVRAKMILGDLLFNQNEFDLASQVYEEVIGQYAFSGFVVKALGKLVVCSEKLKQPEKQAKYYSLLHDFFEAT